MSKNTKAAGAKAPPAAAASPAEPDTLLFERTVDGQVAAINEGKTDRFVAGYVIRPGHSRIFNEADLPPGVLPAAQAAEAAPEAPAEDADEERRALVAEALGGTADQALKALAAICQVGAVLPEEREAVIDAMEAAEIRGAKRQSVLDALAKAKLAGAAA